MGGELTLWEILKENVSGWILTIIIVVVMIMRHGAPIVERWIKVHEKWRKASGLGKDAFIGMLTETNEYLKNEIEVMRKKEEKMLKELDELKRKEKK